MTRPELRVPARYYLRLSDVLIREGQDFNAVLRKAGLKAVDLADPNASLSLADVDSLIALSCQACRRTDIGIDLGRQVSVYTHSVVGFGMVSSPDLYSALQFMARYWRLVLPSFRMRCTAEDRFTELHFTPTAPLNHLTFAVHLDAIATASMRYVHDMIGDRTPPCTISFSVEEPLHASRLLDLGDVATVFTSGTPGVCMRFRGRLSKFKLSLADTDAFRFAEERCRLMVQQVTEVRQFGEWVAMMLREVGDGMPSLEELASILNLSTRTLARYLHRENTNFREISARVQLELAQERLSSGATSITEVAHSLGFTDSGNFSRAFRSKTGTNPRAYRREAWSESSKGEASKSTRSVPAESHPSPKAKE